MLKIILFITLISPLVSLSQDTLKIIKPSMVYQPDLSIETQKKLIRQLELSSKDSLSVSETIELDSLLYSYGETMESVWDIISMGCSWYCGGGNYKVTSSSNLPNNNSIRYEAKSANDLSYKTAWVEGTESEGIGEFLEYTFENNSPRITEIIVSNGYLKTQKTWQENNRVKLLKLYVNNKPYSYLNLQDSRTDQVFKVGTLGHNKDGSDLVLKFEIVEVYRGSKYNDTAITEIYFDGIDVH